MKTKIQLKTLFGVFMLALLVSCQNEVWQEETAVSDGFLKIDFETDVPAMDEVISRSVDLDGGGVQNITLFCFDYYGLFISTVQANLKPIDSMKGTFSALVADNTRIIHFVANQNMSNFNEDDFRGKSEAEVMNMLEATSGMMVYWGRFACDANNNASIKDQIVAKGGMIHLLRNHAKISVADPDNNGYLKVTGFAVNNVNAFGTVAPYHPEKGYNFDWLTDVFVTMPIDESKLSEIESVSSNNGQYVYESENRLDDPVSVIIRGHKPGETNAQDKYYRVMLLDSNGEQLLVRRNHHYKLVFKGELSFGQNTLEEAKSAAATNNVWISISDKVNEVEDTKYILNVEKTDYVLDEEFTGQSYLIKYTLRGKNGTAIVSADKPEISWIENNVASQNFDNKFEVVDGVGYGTIQIFLLSMDVNSKLEGTLLVKKGRLQRKIKVTTIKQMNFEPMWVGSEVYGKIEGTNTLHSHVTAMFTIPEDCPKELFPMKVYITAEDLDIRNASGMKLKVVRDGDPEYYGDKTKQGYKYVFEVEKPGVQRIYFNSILNQQVGTIKRIAVEAPYFEKIEQSFVFSAHLKSITVKGLSEYPDPSQDYAKDELIFYRLVPKKRNAVVPFDLQLVEKSATDPNYENPISPTDKDEFLLYSHYLDAFKDSEAQDLGVAQFDCKFYPAETEAWWPQMNPKGGRVLMFEPKTTSTPTGEYTIYMHTTRAESAEVIRIASNRADYIPVLSSNASASTNFYGGEVYRSYTFELANYNPFGFYAQVDGVGSAEYPVEPQSPKELVENPEILTNLLWPYGPGKQVVVEFDVTSFKGSDGKSVDPFGESFEIYIDAPMLELDESRFGEFKMTQAKLKADPIIPGRFVYTVDEKREVERAFGFDEVGHKDRTIPAVSQRGERKRLPFKVKDIVSLGTIKLSSNKEKVVFWDKSFKVSNAPITGTIQYKDSQGRLQPIPKDQFVTFAATATGNRIGAMTITEDGKYKLALRKEYKFTWNSDEVEVEYSTHETPARDVTKRITSLAQLSANPNLVLE